MKKEIIKSCIKVSFIFLVAILSTYYIYYRFQNNRSIDINSESLDVVFHEYTQNRIQLLKVTPVTDSVGLSSPSYSFDIYNNLTIENYYQIKIVLDEEKINEDNCSDMLIPEEDIRISIKVDREPNQIYTLSELEDGVILTKTIEPLKKDNISIRLWINKDTKLPGGSQMHYHGFIKVIEQEEIIDDVE